MKIKSLLTILICSAFAVASCTKNPTGNPDNPGGSDTPTPSDSVAVSITGVPEGTPVFVVPEKSVSLSLETYNAAEISFAELPAGWTAAISADSSAIDVTASAEASTLATLTLTATSSGGKTATCSQELYCLNSFDDPNGVFVLNEGNMTTENGSLTYITPEGYVIDDAYSTVNGTQLGNVAQDMAFANGKIYIISQNGDSNAVGTEFENDGMLVVMDGKTLKKEVAIPKSELSTLDWPTHIAVLDDQHVYLRDNKGVYCLDITTKALTFVEGTENAPKSRFVVQNGKVYTSVSSSYFYSILEISAESNTANNIKLPYSAPYKTVYSIASAGDGNMWLSAEGFGSYYIGKFNLTTGDLISRKIGVEPNAGSSGVLFVADGNDIYYTSGTTVYRMKFDESPELDPDAGLDAEEMLVDLYGLDSNAGLMYNGLGIHPLTRHIYINTLKGFAQFDQNQIWEFDFNANLENPVAKYDNHTSFPAGFFFYPQM